MLALVIQICKFSDFTQNYWALTFYRFKVFSFLTIVHANEQHYSASWCFYYHSFSSMVISTILANYIVESLLGDWLVQCETQLKVNQQVNNISFS
jgi:hypothetical protein